MQFELWNPWIKLLCSCPRFSANETISVLDLSDRVFAMTDYC